LVFLISANNKNVLIKTTKPGVIMNFFEAMQSLQKGKRIRITSWPEASYIGLMEEK